MDVCHLSAPCELRNTMLGALCWSEMRRCGSGYFQWGISSSTAAFLSLSLSLFLFLHGFFFPTEGKQMRLNINSRLLMQHCAKICAPAAWIERTARLKRKKKTPASSSSSSSPLSFSILPDEQLLGRQTEELVASCSAPQTERETIRFVHTHSWSSTFTAALLRSVPSPNTQRESSSAYVLSGLVQVDLLSLAREAFEWLLDVIHRESRYKQQLSAGVFVC